MSVARHGAGRRRQKRRLRTVQLVCSQRAHLLCAQDLLPNTFRRRLVEVGGLLCSHRASEDSWMCALEPGGSCLPPESVPGACSEARAKVQCCEHRLAAREVSQLEYYVSSASPVQPVCCAGRVGVPCTCSRAPRSAELSCKQPRARNACTPFARHVKRPVERPVDIFSAGCKPLHMYALLVACLCAASLNTVERVQSRAPNFARSSYGPALVNKAQGSVKSLRRQPARRLSLCGMYASRSVCVQQAVCRQDNLSSPCF